MLRGLFRRSLRGSISAERILLAVAAALLPATVALALIEGGVGNQPISKPDWPNGADLIFNNRGRVAWWVGPPFGGGEWHAECRGDAAAFSAVLAEFAKLDVQAKRVVVHDGVGASFWLNPNREPEKRKAAEIDWTFMVWQSTNWQRLSTMPVDVNPTVGRGADLSPPSQIDVYTGGQIKWSDVVVPPGLEVRDERLEAHGFALADGVVLEGSVFDLSNKRPIVVTARLQRVDRKPKGGYDYVDVSSTTSDEKGRWVIKKAPSGTHRIVVEAPGYLPRIAAHVQISDEPSWQSVPIGLAPPVTVSGRVTDQENNPLESVQVRLSDIATGVDGRYETPDGFTTTTDAAGKFSISVPAGEASVRVHKPGYNRPGLGEPIVAPIADLALVMQQAARVQVTVDFAGKQRPAGYIVHMVPEGGEEVGKWSGSSNIDDKSQVTYENVPPGRYVLHGMPNPGRETDRSPAIAVDLKGGETTEVKLPAK